MGRARIALAIAVALVAARATPAEATIFTLRPMASFGETDNPFGISVDQTAPEWQAFAVAALTTDLQLNLARSNHRFAYTINHTWYQHAADADNTSHALLWTSSFNLNGSTTLAIGANANIYSYSAIASVDPATANPTGAPVGTGPTTVATFVASETLTYEKSERAKYAETFSALRFEPLITSTPVPTTTTLAGMGRADRQRGRDDWSLTLNGSYYIIDSSTIPTSSLVAGSVINFQALAGWRRELNANTTLELSGGPLAFYGVGAHSLAIGPAAIATLSYRHLPWYATLSLSQQPTVNIYIGEALLADAAVARVAIPLDKRERFTLIGLGGYTYARQIAGSQHFIFAPRAYDLFLLDGGFAYHFERVPFFVSADYSVTTQRGSLTDGIYVANYLRRIVSVSLGGQLAWGEGNMGFRTPPQGN